MSDKGKIYAVWCERFGDKPDDNGCSKVGTYRTLDEAISAASALIGYATTHFGERRSDAVLWIDDPSYGDFARKGEVGYLQWTIECASRQINVLVKGMEYEKRGGDTVMLCYERNSNELSTDAGGFINEMTAFEVKTNLQDWDTESPMAWVEAQLKLAAENGYKPLTDSNDPLSLGEPVSWTVYNSDKNRGKTGEDAGLYYSVCIQSTNEDHC